MTLQTFNFEGVDGATLSGTNIAKSGTGTFVFSAADAVVGATGGRITSAAANALGARCTITSAKIQAIDFFITTPATPASGTYALMTLRHASGLILTLEYDTLNRIGTFETAGASRQTTGNILANNTRFRAQILVSIGVATNDSSYTLKMFSSASNWTTQIGSTLTRSAINLGTVAAVAVDIGMITAAATSQVVGFDYLRVDDGKTTDFTAIPAVTGPTSVAGASDLYPLVGDTVSLTGGSSTAGTGTLTYAWTCTAFPSSGSSPSITNPATATATFVPAVGSRYTFNLRVTQTGGLFADATIVVYPHAISSGDVKVYDLLSNTGGWTNEGGAASLVAALNDGLSTTYAQSPVGPAGQLLRVIMDPYGPGSISVFVTGNWTGGTLTRTVHVYLEDGVTLLQTDTYALTSVETEREVILDAGDLIAASPGAGRRALVVDWSDA